MSRHVFAPIAVALLALAPLVHAQVDPLTSDQRARLTREWKGERFEDGRPKVPDSLLKRMKEVTAEEAWGVINKAGFPDQFEGDWNRIRPDEPRLVGRVVTARFLPLRPDLDKLVKDIGQEEGRVGKGQNSWVIDTLQPGDVLVVDLYEKYNFMGDNLATSVFAKTGNGVVINGGVRDLSGMQDIEGFTAYVRTFHPSTVTHGVFNTMLMGINVPIRIGDTTVMPGDVVVGDPEGLMFVPPQLAEDVALAGERIRLRDEWGHRMLREGRYTPGEVDQRWTPEMQQEFEAWLKQRR